MFLNWGSYGDGRILSPPTVAAMTRNQIPGISARHGEEFFPEASWGFGWGIKGEKKWVDGGTLDSSGTFSHAGCGGVLLWADPVYEIVGTYFSVSLSWDEGPFFRHYRQSDLFVNMVTGAMLD
jgi:CubicO group peptidase (beta-lactamase class C family)